MIDIRTGKEMTRRDFGRGLAAIIGAGVAPSIALGTIASSGSANASVGGMMRGIGARNAAMFGGGKLTAKDYVQDGLIAMWDGIENAGWGTHSDSISVWSDLINAGYGINLSNCIINKDSIGLENGFGSSESYRSILNLNTNLTLEILFEGDFHSESHLLQTGYSVAFGSYSNLFICSYKNYVPQPLKVSGIRKAVITYQPGNEYPTPKSSYFDGVQRDLDSSEFWATTRNYLRIGSWRKEFKDRGYSGKCNAIRIYSKELSEEEMALNYAVDKVRFDLQ